MSLAVKILWQHPRDRFFYWRGKANYLGIAIFKKNKENRLSSTNFKSSTTLRNATVNVFLKSTIKNQDSTRDFKDFNFNNKTKKSVLVNEIAGSYPSLVTPQVMQNVNDEFNNKQLINKWMYWWRNESTNDIIN